LPSPSKHLKHAKGFTLAELLIALAILGVIATFTIPKIITSQANSRYNAATKEILSTVAAAYQQYISVNGASGSIGMAALTQYMNYTKPDSTTTIDANSGTYACGGAGKACVAFHSGAYLFYNPGSYFSGTNTTNAVFFGVDPTGAADSTPGMVFLLTYPGKVFSAGDIDTTYTSSTGTSNPGGTNASWFSW